MSDFSQEMREAFVEDTAPLVEDLGQAVLALERAIASGAASDELSRHIRARLHTIKGNAGMVGEALIVELSHVLEDACFLIAAPGVSQAGLIELLLKGSDLLNATLAGERAEHRRGLDELTQKLSHLDGGEVRSEPLALDTSEKAFDSSAPQKRNLRVDLGLLDRMLDGLSEAISLQASVELARGFADSSADDEGERLHRLGASLRSLRELLVRARLVPLSGLFGKFSRPVRDLAKERGLEVELVHAGGEHSVDKAICDQLGEPLLHIVRNAIAHGIEPAEVRVRAGKPRTGTIRVSARADGDRTVISVSDDGRGFSVAGLRARAAELGIDSSGMSDEECLRLALLPGISTAQQVDELSGRGAGLDAAAHAIKELGGSLAIRSRAGEGATFVLELPSSLSLLKGLLVRIGQERYVLPASSVVQTLRVTSDLLHEVNGKRVLTWKELVPWLSLGELLELKQAQKAAALDSPYGVIVHTGTSVRALGVDAVLGAIEVVVKPIERDLTRLSFISGATVLGDGGVVLILNPRALSETRVHESRVQHG